MINRAKISGTIGVLLGITMLTGCGLADKIPGNDIAEEQTVQEETSTDTDTAEEAEADADTVEETEGTPVISFESGGPGFKRGNDADEPAEETSDVYDYETVYAPVLSEIKEVLTSGYDYEKDYAYISTGLMERCMYPEDDVLPEVIGYTYTDINGDDIPELLIGENDGYEYDDTQYVSYIYSGFTIIDDEPVLFLEGWARNRYHWMGDGYFFNTGSGGAMNTIFGQGHLPPGGDSIEWDDFYFSDEDIANGGMAFFRNTTGNCDPGESERLNMSEHKFLRILNSYKCEPVSWTFFPYDPENVGDIDQSMITDGMLIPDSDSRYLTEDDLKGFTAEELRIARNEIYARYGRKFNDSKLQEHFNSMDWYFPTTEPGDFDESILNDYEIKNLDLIAKYEKKVQ